MSITLRLDNYRTNDFVTLAGRFGSERYDYVVTPNVDHIIRYWDEASYRRLYADAGFILLDSRFLARIIRLFQGARPQVTPGSDLTSALFSKVIGPEDTVVLIGGTDEQAQTLARRFGLRGLRHFNPPMGFIHDSHATTACLEYIEAQSPFRFCFLAVGCPQQEILAHQLKHRGRARGLALCVGASINFLTGIERRAPGWMQSLGMEWLYRLLRDPVRLARRYLVRGPRIFTMLPWMRIELTEPN